MKRKNLFISQVFNSVTKFDSYKEVSNHSLPSSFIYFFILIFLYASIMTVGVVHKTKTSFENVRSIVQEEIQDLNYENGVLSVNNGEHKSIRDGYIIIDTSEDAQLEGYDSSLVFGRNNFYVNTDEGKYQFEYKHFIIENMNKEQLLDMLDINKYMVLLIIIALVVAFVLLTISTMLDVLVISSVGMIVSIFQRSNKVKFKNAFNMAVHALTLSIILGMMYSIVNAFTGFNIKYFSIMYTLVAAIYMITAVILVNADENAKR